MTTQQLQLFRQQWEAELAKQSKHSVYLPVRVRWDLPWDETGAIVETGIRVSVDESRVAEPLTDASRANPWLDPRFVVQSQRVQWAGSYRVPWSAVGEGGKTIKPLAILLQARKKLCEGTEKDPFSQGYISEGYRGIFIEMCQLRLERPGAVLELLELGGNRGGKTFEFIRTAVAAWLAAPRPEGTDYGPQWKGRLLIMHAGEKLSADQHQKPFYHLMPASVRAQARGASGSSRMKKAEDQVFNWTGDRFGNEQFDLCVDIKEPDGTIRTTGGEVLFRSYYGDPNTYEGPEYNAILLDEVVPLEVYENMKRGLTSRAAVTNESWFLAEIRRLLDLLKAGVPLNQIPRHLFGLLLQSWIVAMFTPLKGFTQLVRAKLQGIKPSDMYGWYDSPILASMPGVPAGDYDEGGKLKLGSDKRKVPQYARDPANKNQLIVWFHTRWNCYKPAVNELLELYRAGGYKEVRTRLYGYVESDTSAVFAAAYDSARHLFDWTDLPKDLHGTFYETIDPAGAKPDAIAWDLVDPFQRVTQLQEWPCESWEINSALPGPWAVPSVKSERMNGEEGPVWSLPKPSISKRILQIWEGRRRVLEKLREAGITYRGKTQKRKLVLEWHANGKGGITVVKEDEEREYIVPHMTIMDGRFASAHTDSVKGNEDVTIADRFLEDPNSIRITPADGVRLTEGDQLIVDALLTENNGKPNLRINRECTNTQFTLTYYTHPKFRDATLAKDEACKEWRDLKAYLLLKRPRYVDPTPPPDTSWQGF
jgi:hypothetical protein